jgi:hypothetical protein
MDSVLRVVVYCKIPILCQSLAKSAQILLVISLTGLMNFTNSARGYLDSDLEVFISHFKSCSHALKTQIKVEKKCFYWCSTFYSPSRVFNHEYNL